VSAPALPALGDHDSVRVIASGGMGLVLEVRNRRTGASYAAKVILQARDPHARERFRREAELVARCDQHPGIVKVHTLGETREGSLYMILDLVRGESLDALLRREGRLEARRAATLALGIANALGFVHERGILHRDVKPSNVLLDATAPDPFGAPRLTDFGLATARDVQRLTVTGTFLGTLHYAAPEQAAGRATSAASDVFSLGCVLFHALSGTTAIDAGTSLELMARLSDERPLDDVRTRAPDVPASLAAIVARAVTKDPAERYANGRALARDLERFLAGEDVKFVPARRRRRQGLLMLAGAALTATVLATVAGLLLHGQHVRAGEALAAAHDEVARARATRARPNATEAELAEARERLRRATEGRALATRLGADPDEALGREIAILDDDLAGAVARAALARGDAAAALATIDASAAGAPSPRNRALRGRALLSLGRPEEALREVEGGKDAEALEVAGDAHVALEHPDRAVEAYGRALALAPRAAEPRLRARRGGAAALAGDDAVARADATALVGNPPALPQDAASIAAIGSIAPALYRRGLAAKAGGGRDLEAAWRLAPPPPALEAGVMKAWAAAADADAAAWNAERIALLRLNDADIDRLAAILEVAARIRRFDPGASMPEIAESLQFFRNGISTRLTEKGTSAAAHRILALAPDDPNVLFVIGSLADGSPGNGLREGLDAFYRALAHLTESSAGHDSRFPSNITITVCQFLERNALPLEAEPLLHGGEVAGTSSAWESLGALFMVRCRYELALRCFERGERCPTPEGNRPDAGSFVVRRADALASLGRIEEAAELALSFHEANPANDAGTVALANVRDRTGDWDGVLALADPSRVTSGTLGLLVVRALSRTGRPEEARAILARLKGRTKLQEDMRWVEGEIALDEARRQIAALLRDGKKDEALARARRLSDESQTQGATAILAATLNRCGLAREAVGAVDRIAKPGAPAKLERGLALVTLADLEGARAVVADMKRHGDAYEARPLEAALALAEKGKGR
jgi:tetratricopeptide (TPR) repeat protein